MKTLFFIAALAGAAYLIMQTPAGKAWLAQSEPELNIQQEIEKAEQFKTQVTQSVEKKITELAQHLNQKQQAQITQLENRIAELEDQLMMIGATHKPQQQSVSNSKVTLHPYKPTEKQFIAQPSHQDFTLNKQATQPLASTSDDTLQRKRQAKLQDIVQKMEMSSLQALVN